MVHVRVFEPQDNLNIKTVFVAGTQMVVNWNSYSPIARAVVDMDELKVTGANRKTKFRAILRSDASTNYIYVRLYNVTDVGVVTGSEIRTNSTTPVIVEADVTDYFTGRAGVKLFELQAYVTGAYNGYVHYSELLHNFVVVIK